MNNLRSALYKHWHYTLRYTMQINLSIYLYILYYFLRILRNWRLEKKACFGPFSQAPKSTLGPALIKTAIFYRREWGKQANKKGTPQRVP